MAVSLGLVVVSGALLFVSLGIAMVFAYPAAVCGVVLLMNPWKSSRRIEIAELALMEATLAWFFFPGFYKNVVTPGEDSLAIIVVVLAFLIPPIVFCCSATTGGGWQSLLWSFLFS